MHALRAISPQIHVLFYADDLLLYIPLPPRPACALLPPSIFEQLRRFGLFVGLQLNLSKSAFLTKGTWPEQYVEVLSSLGISIKRKVKYPGILLGHVTSEETYAPVLARATLRAHFMSNLPLTQDERVALFQEWVLPLFIFPARGYFPTDHVVAKLSVIYKVALRLNSWGLTLPIMAMPPNLGGNHLPQPRMFLLWQHATPFVLSKVEPQGVPALSRQHLKPGHATTGCHWMVGFYHGSSWDPSHGKPTPFLGMSCKAYSLLRKKVPVATRRDKLIPDMPLWHSVWFRDTHNNTYYSPSMIRKGIHGVANGQSNGGGGAPSPAHGHHCTRQGWACFTHGQSRDPPPPPPQRPLRLSGWHGTSGPCSDT